MQGDDLIVNTAGAVSRWKNKLGIQDDFFVKVGIACGRHDRAQIISQRYVDGRVYYFFIIDPRTHPNEIEAVVKKEMVYFWLKRFLLEQEGSDIILTLKSIIDRKIEYLQKGIDIDELNKAIEEGVKDLVDRVAYLF